jgi:hypothetical protein
MSRFSVLLAVVLVGAVAAPMSMGAPVQPVAAQENSTTTNETTTAADVEPGERTKRIDSTTRITNWRYDENSQEFVLTVESEIPASMTAAESVPSGEGMREAAIVERQLYVGTNTVRVPARKTNGTAVISITTSKSIDAQRQIIVQYGERDDDEANPFETFGGESGLFWGVGMTVILAALAAWYTVRTEASGVVEA